MKNRKTKSTVNPTPVLISGLAFIFILSACTAKPAKEPAEPVAAIHHGIVYIEEGRFAGWPANHGIWSWDNEILVGFVTADHMERTGHTYDRLTARNKYARSNDGGQSWIIEDAYEHGQTGWGFDNNISNEKAKIPVPLSTAMEDFTNPGFIFTFLRQHNDHGPSHFYYSNNKGAKWEGPFIFHDLNTDGVATRTDYIVDGPKELIAFLTVAKSNKKEGRVVMVRTTTGGLNWEVVSWIGPEPEGFDIMPSSVRLSASEILTVIRTRTENSQDLLTAYLSDDNGKTWNKLKDPVADTGRGGSPPALLKMQDGRLALAYAYRSQYGSRINIRFSANNGSTWSDEIILRSGDGATRDVGYPRMVQRPDGKLVIIYYWNNAVQEGAKPYRYIASTIVDPDQWK